jgi:glycosyltransferase involved in cell wall biosynthesis
MTRPELSVILCAHNSKEASVRRVLDALAVQSLPADRWELVIVDNASNPPLAEKGWHLPANARIVVEPELGLTPARVAGIRSASAAIVVLIDDDTVPDQTYLHVAREHMRTYADVGAAGGRIQGEFEVPPPSWASGFLDLLALRDFGDRPIRALIYNEVGPWEPCGAGMVIRAEVARTYANRASDPARRRLDRVGASLSSCGDTDLARTATDIGLLLAYEPRLRLTHLIPAGRTRLRYLARLAYSVQRDGWLLYRIRGRQCQISGGRLLVHLLLLPIRSFAMNPCRWLLKAASAYGQIKGRSQAVLTHD